MTAASAYPPRSADKDGRPAEPSMEDILASIRRIIADDHNQAGRGTSTNGAPHAPSESQLAIPVDLDRDGSREPSRARTPYDDVLDLARLVPTAGHAPHGAEASHEAQHAAYRHDDGLPHDPRDLAAAELHEDAATRDVDARHAGQEIDGESASADETEDGEWEGGLLAAPLGASVMSSFETLAATVVLQNTPMLERVMRDSLRPLLKAWLDDNLPTLVERLVRTEIERVARGGRG